MRHSTLLVIITLLGLWGCSGKPAPLQLAVMMPLSAGPTPRQTLPNIEWARAVVNAAGGIQGRELQVDYYDINPDNLADMAQTLAADDRYLAVIGPGTSAMLMAVADTFLRYRKPLVSFTSTSAEVLRTYGKQGVIWRTRQSDIAQTEVMLRHAKARGAQRLGLLTSIDENGATFFSWFGFFAQELGYSTDAIDIETLDESTTCDAAAMASLAFNPDVLFVAASTSQEQTCVLKAAGPLASRVQFADTGLDVQAIGQGPGAPPPSGGYGGFGGSTSASFDAAYRAHNGSAAMPISASEYDTILLLAYGLTVSAGVGGDALIDALKAVVDGRDLEQYGWDPPGVAGALAALGAGRHPRLLGASAPLVFEPELYVDLKATTFSHFVMSSQGLMVDATYDTSQPDFLTSQGVLVRPSLAASSPIADSSTYTPAVPKSDTWALIAALSSGFGNYRHQADALRQYQLLRQSGVADDHIILIMDDGLAASAQNPLPGVVENEPAGKNLHQNLQIDYDLSLTGQDLQNILTGQVSDRTPKVISMTQGSNLYVYLVGHGGKQGIAIGATTAAAGLLGQSPLAPADLLQALCTLRAEDRLRRGLIVVESCYAGVFGDARYGGVEGLCGSPPSTALSGVTLLAAADNSEVSLAGDYDAAVGTWVNDAFSERFSQLVTGQGLLDLVSLYTQVYLGVSGSHVSLYNTAAAGALGSVQVSEFLTP